MSCPPFSEGRAKAAGGAGDRGSGLFLEKFAEGATDLVAVTTDKVTGSRPASDPIDRAYAPEKDAPDRIDDDANHGRGNVDAKG